VDLSVIDFTMRLTPANIHDPRLMFNSAAVYACSYRRAASVRLHRLPNPTLEPPRPDDRSDLADGTVCALELVTAS
jgi:hypothetical protein